MIEYSKRKNPLELPSRDEFLFNPIEKSYTWYHYSRYGGCTFDISDNEEKRKGRTYSGKGRFAGVTFFSPTIHYPLYFARSTPSYEDAYTHREKYTICKVKVSPYRYKTDKKPLIFDSKSTLFKKSISMLDVNKAFEKALIIIEKYIETNPYGMSSNKFGYRGTWLLFAMDKHKFKDSTEESLYDEVFNDILTNTGFSLLREILENLESIFNYDIRKWKRGGKNKTIDSQVYRSVMWNGVKSLFIALYQRYWGAFDIENERLEGSSVVFDWIKRTGFVGWWETEAYLTLEGTYRSGYKYPEDLMLAIIYPSKIQVEDTLELTDFEAEALVEEEEFKRPNPLQNFETYTQEDYFKREKKVDPYVLAQDLGIYIGLDNEFQIGHYDAEKGILASALFIDEGPDSQDCFSFDIVVNPSYQKMGLGSELVDWAIDVYESVKYELQDANLTDDTYNYCVSVVNPNMEKILIRKGFSVAKEYSFLTKNRGYTPKLMKRD